MLGCIARLGAVGNLRFFLLYALMEQILTLGGVGTGSRWFGQCLKKNALFLWRSCLRLQARRFLWCKQKMEKPLRRWEIQKSTLMTIHIGWIHQQKLTQQTTNPNFIQGNCSQCRMFGWGRRVSWALPFVLNCGSVLKTVEFKDCKE